MPTRSAFLTNGLVPITISGDEVDDCIICACAYTDPINLPCGHIFDKHCIEQWLNTKGSNTCPMCKRKLFELQGEEDRTFGGERRQLVAQALRTSGLNELGAASAMQKYGAPTPTVSEIQRATAHACHYLGQERPTVAGSSVPDGGSSDEPLTVSGPAIINPAQISPDFIAMANLIPAFAASQGRAYTAQQSCDWKLVLTYLWAILKQQDGKKEDALVLAHKWRKSVKKQLRAFYSDADTIDFFFTYADPSFANPCFDDLELLLNYLTFRCWGMQREEEAAVTRRREAKGKQGEARPGSKTKGTCGVM